MGKNLYCLNKERKVNNMTTKEIRNRLTENKDKSAWKKGVTVYALELLDDLEEQIDGRYLTEEIFDSPKLLDKAMLNGAKDWNQYSWGGCSLICDRDIAERLCTPSELKRTRNGERRPNHNEEWLDVQAKALSQAARKIRVTVNELK